MSGGTYNYLCLLNASELFGNIDELDKMYERLVELGYINAANETKNIIELYNSVNSKMGGLQQVWRAIEWLDSGDSGVEEITAAILEFDSKYTK